MRRRPHEDDEEEHRAFERDAARHRRPADHRREGARRAPDHDVLRRPTLQPHRVDRHIEEDREGQQRRRDPVHEHAHRHHGEDGEDRAEGGRLARGDAPGGNRAAQCARHARIDIRVIPHVQRAGRARADGNAEKRGKADHGMDAARRNGDADKRGEDHERHHARLQQLEEIARGSRAAIGQGSFAFVADRRIGHELDLSSLRVAELGHSARKGAPAGSSPAGAVLI